MADAWVDITPSQGWEWEQVPAGPLLATVIAGVDAGELSTEARISYLKACDRLSTWSAGQAAYALASAGYALGADTGTTTATVDFDSRAHQWTLTELSAALHLAPATVGKRLIHATVITETHREIWSAMNAGQITWPQACVLADVINTIIDDDDADADDRGHDLLAQVLPTAGNYPPARLRERATHLLMRLAPDTAIKQRKSATRNRTDVSLWPDRDGIATLGVTGSAIDLTALHSIITTHAEQLAALDPECDRTAGQWRVAATLNLAGIASADLPISTTDPTTATGGRAIPDVVINVVMDMATITGLSDNPAHLPGYGPLDPELARQLAASADWQRWVTDPVTGHLLDDGARRLPTAKLARYIKARDLRCAAPSCGRTRALDVDHTPTWAATHTTNAAQLTVSCVTHNRTRDRAQWITPEPRTWGTPHGRTYKTLMHQCLPQPDPEPDPPPLWDPPPF
jgi:hypothetical protein